MTNTRGERTRLRILETAWDLSGSRGVAQLLAGVTLREVAAAAGMTPSAVSYHFPSMEGLALAMVENYVEVHIARTNPEELEAIAVSLAPVGREGLARVIRAAADASMALRLTEEGFQDDWRLLRCRAAVGASPPGAAAELVGALDASWAQNLAEVYRIATEQAGCRLLSPLTFEDLALTGAALSAGLQQAWGCRPESVRPGLLGDVLTAVCSAVLVPVDRPGGLQELDASLPVPPSGEPLRSGDLVAMAASVAHMFSDGLDVPTMAEVGIALDCTPTELVRHYGSMQRLAAISFARHVPVIAAATLRRPDAGAEVRLADGLSELVRSVWADRSCARALLLQRLEDGTRWEARGQGERIGDLVPLAAGLRRPLEELVGGDAAQCEDVAEVMVGLEIEYAVTRTQGSLSGLVELAMRLVPGPADGL